MNPIATRKAGGQQYRTLPSKPSKQSLVARGLAVSEKSASTRILMCKSQKAKPPKPGFNLHHSSDSDADQVYSTSKKLDRCASLLANILEEKENVPKKKTSLKTKQNVGKKVDKKKVVKIILPATSQKQDNEAKDKHPKSVPSSLTMITSTPTSIKRKTSKSKENELKSQLSQIEQEKHLLQEQYASLLHKHLNTPTSQQNVKYRNQKKMCDIAENEDTLEPCRDNIHGYKHDVDIISSVQFNANSLISETPITSGISQEQGTLSMPVFKDLESTIHRISEKLSFPGSLTPSSNGSLLVNTSRKYLPSIDCTPSSSHYIRNDYPNNDVSYYSSCIDTEARSSYDRTEGTCNNGSESTRSLESRNTAWPIDNFSTNARTDSTLPATLCDSSEASDDSDSSSLQSTVDEDRITSSEGAKDNHDIVNTESSSWDSNLIEKQEILSPNSTIVASDEEISNESDDISIDDGSLSADGAKEMISNEGGTCVDKNQIHRAEKESWAVPTNECTETDSINKQDKRNENNENQAHKKPRANIIKKRGEKPKAFVKKSDNAKLDKTGGKSNGISNGQCKSHNRQKNEIKKSKLFSTTAGKKNFSKADSDSAGNHNEEIPEQSPTDRPVVDRPKYYVSPKGVENKPLMEVTSQLASLKDGVSDLKGAKISNPGLHEKPAHAATQITMLSYLFKELITLLGDKLTSEEGRLLTEIDHIIGLLPFVMNNLNPDLQTEVSLAVQPLRVENSDLRRQLRIANQKTRDFEARIVKLKKKLSNAKKRTIDHEHLEKLRNQIDVDGDQRKALVEKITEVNKTIEDLKSENQNLLQKIANKDAEDVHKVKQLQKEKVALSSENSLLLNKMESLSLNLQAHEKENKILKLSISQSEAEIARVKELNRGLQESVAKLLQDVNFKDARPSDILEWKNTRYSNPKPIIQDIQIPTRERPKSSFKRTANGDKEVENRKKRFSRPTIQDHNNNHLIKEPSILTDNFAKPYLKTNDSKRPKLSVTNSDRPLHQQATVEMPKIGSNLSSDIACEALSSTVDSESTGIRSITSCSEIDSCVSMDDRYSTLTCDSGEFQLDLANLDANIKKLQRSLQTAKAT